MASIRFPKLRSGSPVFGYTLAVVLALLAQAARARLDPPTVIPFIPYAPFIVISAAGGGTLPGLLTTVLCAAECLYFAVEPLGALAIANSRDVLGLLCLIFTGVVSSLSFGGLKRTGQALTRANQALRMALAAGKAGAWDLNLQTGELSWSKEYRQLLEVGPDFRPTLEGFLALVHPDDRDLGRTDIETATAARSPIFQNQFRGVLTDGLHWMERRGAVQCDSAGKPLRMVGITSDITEQKRAQEALRRSEQIYRAIGESIDYGIWICAPDGRNIYASDSFLKLVGLTQQQCSDFGWGEVLHPDDAERTIASWKECVRTEGTWDIEHRFRGVDGEFHPVLARGIPVRDDQGQGTCWAGINLDISDIKRTEEALRRSNQDLEQFAYAASHDLQEPLRMISAYTEMLARRYRSQLDEQADQFISWTTEGALRMQALLRGLLEYSRLNQEFEHIDTVDSTAVLEAALHNLKAAANDSGAIITYEALPEVRMPEIHLLQLFKNLFANAIRYRSELPPRIHVSASRQGKWQRFAVTDNGIGIAPQYSERIFKIFKRLKPEGNPGTGIGLAVCKRIVERQGGRIWVQSAPGQGATFYFTLPAAVQPTHP